MLLLSFVNDAYAMAPQASQSGGQGWMGQMILFGAIFLIFFLLVIRPQQKKVKKHQEMVSKLGKGDKIVTASGIYGTVVKFYDDKDYLELEIANKTVIKIQKSQVGGIEKLKNAPEAEKPVVEEKKEDDSSEEK